MKELKHCADVPFFSLSLASSFLQRLFVLVVVVILKSATALQNFPDPTLLRKSIPESCPRTLKRIKRVDTNPKLAFMHITKAGGTTVEWVLHREASARNYTRVSERNQSMHSRSLSENVFCAFLCLVFVCFFLVLRFAVVDMFASPPGPPARRWQAAGTSRPVLTPGASKQTPAQPKQTKDTKEKKKTSNRDKPARLTRKGALGGPTGMKLRQNSS